MSANIDPAAICTFLAALFILYAIVPTLLTRLGMFSRRRGADSRPRVAITFDDGPHPVYTEQLLDVLDQEQVPACFFVLGERARRFPHLIRRMHKSGHEIGIHSYRHQLPWLLGPYHVVSDFHLTCRTIEEITGQKPRYFRPPWGICNLMHLCYCYARNIRLILWSFMSWDWLKNTSADKIYHLVLRQIKPGHVLIFHDSDHICGAAPGAPRHTIDALPRIIRQLRERGWQIVPLSELLQTRPRRIWLEMWEKLFARLARIQRLSDNGRPTVFRLALRRYRGRPLVLPDGTTLTSRQPVLELHLDNDYLQELAAGAGSPERVALRTLRAVQQSLPALARHIEQNPELSRVRALVGITILHRGAEKLGFGVYPLTSGWLSRAITFYQRILLRLWHPAGKARIENQQARLEARLLVMSTTTLRELYGRDTVPREGNLFNAQ